MSIIIRKTSIKLQQVRAPLEEPNMDDLIVQKIIHVTLCLWLTMDRALNNPTWCFIYLSVVLCIFIIFLLGTCLVVRDSRGSQEYRRSSITTDSGKEFNYFDTLDDTRTELTDTLQSNMRSQTYYENVQLSFRRNNDI